MKAIILYDIEDYSDSMYVAKMYRDLMFSYLDSSWTLIPEEIEVAKQLINDAHLFTLRYFYYAKSETDRYISYSTLYDCINELYNTINYIIDFCINPKMQTY
jgi:hypothetical protein